MAEKIVGALSSFCDQIDIAGSIRRRRPEVNDIDLVILPKFVQLAALQSRAMQNARCVTAGDQNMIVELATSPYGGQPLQIDLFFAQPEAKSLFETTPTNYGSLLLCRTGSKQHNIWLIEHAKKLGLSWNPYYGVFGLDLRTHRPVCLASATEQEIFDALELEFVPPERRER